MKLERKETANDCRVLFVYRFQMKVEGQRHSLMVSKVADNMALGVHVVAKNDVGEDSCMIDIRTIESSDNNNENDDDNTGNKLMFFVVQRTECKHGNSVCL